MDNFCEQLITKDYGNHQKIMKIAEYFILILATVNLVVMFNFILAIPCYLVYVGVVILNRKTFVEYEYELTMDELVVSKIMNEKKRKKVMAFSISEVQAATKKEVKGKSNNVIKACFAENDNKQYLYVKSESGLKCLVVSLDNKMLNMCYRINPVIFRELNY